MNHGNRKKEIHIFFCLSSNNCSWVLDTVGLMTSSAVVGIAVIVVGSCASIAGDIAGVADMEDIAGTVENIAGTVEDIADIEGTVDIVSTAGKDIHGVGIGLMAHVFLRQYQNHHFLLHLCLCWCLFWSVWFWALMVDLPIQSPIQYLDRLHHLFSCLIAFFCRTNMTISCQYVRFWFSID
jgi:hypothetical protein